MSRLLYGCLVNERFCAQWRQTERPGGPSHALILPGVIIPGCVVDGVESVAKSIGLLAPYRNRVMIDSCNDRGYGRAVGFLDLGKK